MLLSNCFLNSKQLKQWRNLSFNSLLSVMTVSLERCLPSRLTSLAWTRWIGMFEFWHFFLTRKNFYYRDKVLAKTVQKELISEAEPWQSKAELQFWLENIAWIRVLNAMEQSSLLNSFGRAEYISDQLHWEYFITINIFTFQDIGVMDNESWFHYFRNFHPWQWWRQCSTLWPGLAWWIPLNLKSPPRR